jgi:hypothetical protein
MGLSNFWLKNVEKEWVEMPHKKVRKKVSTALSKMSGKPFDVDDNNVMNDVNVNITHVVDLTKLEEVATTCLLQLAARNMDHDKEDDNNNEVDHHGELVEEVAATCLLQLAAHNNDNEVNHHGEVVTLERPKRDGALKSDRKIFMYLDRGHLYPVHVFKTNSDESVQVKFLQPYSKASKKIKSSLLIPATTELLCGFKQRLFESHVRIPKYLEKITQRSQQCGATGRDNMLERIA